MEIRQIPNYPDYGATRDGRIYSYKRNKFLKSFKHPRREVVILYFDKVPFQKMVGRLVFETYFGYEPQCITHKDGDVHNNSLENLIETTTTFLANRANLIKISQRRIREGQRKIFRIDTNTGQINIVKLTPKTDEYICIRSALRRKSITSGGYLYYYDGEKEELVAEIKARIRSNNLSLESLRYRDGWSPFVPIIKKHIKNHQKYLEILEGV